ncbi:MAG: alanine--tRNA ligase [marine bacterium B5-7]|nr:MAG: alanine--tRNA ligase [marine bacterium B5-7]
MKSQDIRDAFLQYFAKQNHTVVPSGSLVPHNDPTLLFTNAGMVPFKDVFLGFDQRDYTRATSSQRCVRAGGKHNDLENVGYTARHHTFFEMLGNFSFGDYFKKEAIQFSWTLLTEVFGLPKEKLWVTVFEDDDETADIWLNDMGVDAARFSRCGAKDNFWAMGDTGPCGPCTEIFYDHGADIPGGPPGSPDEDGDRYIEIWNIVFMQYVRSADASLAPIPKPCVDTGMGLERIAAVLQGVHTNYDTDLFQGIMQATANLAGLPDLTNNSLKVIADHIRATAFLIVDGVLPTNEGRGYVLRRIMRRAMRHGHQLGLHDPFFHELLTPCIEAMGSVGEALAAQKTQIEEVILKEEKQFAKTLTQGLGILTKAMQDLSGDVIPGDVAFRLYDTYGFPFDLTADIAREHQLTVDEPGFQAAMKVQREQSKSASQFKVDYTQRIKLEGKTDFLGYQSLQESTEITTLIQEGKTASTLTTDASAAVVLMQSPFYAESGGQVGDQGEIITDSARFVVQDTQKQGDVFIHSGYLAEGTLHVGETVTAVVTDSLRQQIACNHSATHLLHAALREVLGEHVEQKGSLVKSTGLRFDFSHGESVSPALTEAIETRVQQAIKEALAVETEEMSIDEAKTKGAMALFGEKYAGKVRVLSMGNFSMELCGGTHVKNTADIGEFVITTETSVAAGVRRMEALTGDAAVAWQTEKAEKLRNKQLDIQQKIYQRQKMAAQLANDLKVDAALPELTIKPATQLPTPDTWRAWMHEQQEIHNALQQYQRQVQKSLESLQAKVASQQGDGLLDAAVMVQGINVLAIELKNIDGKQLRQTLDQLKQKLGTAVIILAAVNNGKVQLVAGVTDDATDKIRAGDLVNHVATQVGGRGGGRADMAQAGGTDPSQLETALQSVEAWVQEKLT